MSSRPRRPAISAGSRPSSATFCTTSCSMTSAGEHLQPPGDLVHPLPHVIGKRHSVPNGIAVAPRNLQRFEHQLDHLALGHLPRVALQFLPLELKLGLQTQYLAFETLPHADREDLCTACPPLDPRGVNVLGLVKLTQVRRYRRGRDALRLALDASLRTISEDAIAFSGRPRLTQSSVGRPLPGRTLSVPARP
jgi:hypothetical protein